MTPASAPATRAPSVTPMMAQFLEIKEAHKDYLLFYRMGDFYELFFDDAVVAARALDITLTKRGKHLGQDIPMCGVPIHAAEAYLEQLIKRGHKVAVCEQTEDPAEAKKRGSKSVVRREVVRLVTAGTLTEDSLLDPQASNYLAALHWPAGRDAALALAWTDISTGAVAVLGTKASQWIGDVQRLRPREVLVPAGRLSEIAGHDQVSEAGIVLTPLAESQYHGGRGARRLCEIYGVAQLDGLGDYSAAEVSALAALLDYVALTQKGALPTLRPPVRECSEDLLAIDAGTRSNLELLETQTRERKGSLLWAIDCTVSKPGSRLLGAWLASPLANKARIEERLAATRYFFFEADLRKTIRLRLTGLPDLARSLSRLTLNRGGPRDLALVADAVIAAQEAARALIAGAAESRQALPERLGALIRHLTGPDGAANDLAADLKSGLVPTPPVTPREGKFVERDYDETLEATRALRENSRAVLGELEKRYKEETGIGSLKIKHNNVLGYFIEVSAAQGERLLKAEGGPLAHRQTLANAIRFTSEELNALAGDIEAAQAKALGLERAHFDRWVAEVGALAPVLSLMAEALAELDGLTALADLAQTRSYVEPTLDASPVFEVEDGRHPVVEAMLREQGEAFVANDCKLDASGEAERLLLVTGPNMAGKSTFLRQNALLVILAQIGSFVPARLARIGVVDRLFSRVGAADDLARGRSTFMVEMVETAAILNQSTAQSFVILDEIGRGTATYDGLSIAWAAIEHLHDANACRALFATHYHELTALAEHLDGLANVSMRVREWEGQVVFMHEVIAGAADRSYGIHVADLAGLPKPVIARARALMRQLEKGGRTITVVRGPEDLPLFVSASQAPPDATPAAQAAPAPAPPSPVEERLAAIDPDTLTPRVALDLVYDLKKLLTIGETSS